MRMFKTNASIAALLCAVSASSMAVAQETTSPTTNEPTVIEKTAPAGSATTDSATTDSATMDSMKLTDDEAQAWVDKVVYSSDGKNVGEVAALARDASGNVTELHADVGGFLGIGETRVRLMPSEFKFAGDRVALTIPAERVEGLPRIAK